MVESQNSTPKPATEKSAERNRETQVTHSSTSDIDSESSIDTDILEDWDSWMDDLWHVVLYKIDINHLLCNSCYISHILVQNKNIMSDQWAIKMHAYRKW